MRFVKNPDRNQPLSCVVYFSKIFKVAVLASHVRNFGKIFGWLEVPKTIENPHGSWVRKKGFRE